MPRPGSKKYPTDPEANRRYQKQYLARLKQARDRLAVLEPGARDALAFAAIALTKTGDTAEAAKRRMAQLIPTLYDGHEFDTRATELLKELSDDHEAEDPAVARFKAALAEHAEAARLAWESDDEPSPSEMMRVGDPPRWAGACGDEEYAADLATEAYEKASTAFDTACAAFQKMPNTSTAEAAHSALDEYRKTSAALDTANRAWCAAYAKQSGRRLR